MGREKNKKITKFQLVVMGIFLLSALGIQLWQYRTKTIRLVLGGETIELIVAKSSRQKQTGLGGRDDIGRYDGMIFVGFTPGRLGVVMREMRFPIDVIWFREGKVVDIAPSLPNLPAAPEAELPVYYPRAEADIFLELPAGWVAAHNIKLGDELTLPPG